MILLDRMAYWCFKEQNSHIGQENICEIITRYNEDDDNEVEFAPLLDTCLRAKILKETERGGKYRFVDKNILSYFIARELIRIWNDNLDDTDLKYLIKYIRYGINSNIILFVTYLTNNLYLIKNIIDSTVKYTESWEAFDAVNVNIPYLALMQGNELEAPNENDREKLRKSCAARYNVKVFTRF